jgi:hypothetical protein
MRSRAVQSGDSVPPTSRAKVSRDNVPMFRRKTPSRERFEASSCSSVVTIVAKFGQCFSSSEKKFAFIARAMNVSGYVSVM